MKSCTINPSPTIVRTVRCENGHETIQPVSYRSHALSPEVNQPCAVCNGGITFMSPWRVLLPGGTTHEIEWGIEVAAPSAKDPEAATLIDTTDPDMVYLAAEERRLRAELKSAKENAEHAQREEAKRTGQVRELLIALSSYGYHRNGCRMPMGDCTCGLTDIIKRNNID